MPHPAAAQSILQSIFGIFSGPKPSPSYAPRGLPRQYSPYAPSQGPSQGYSGNSSSSGGSYCTLCVRTCDGFYFPISYGTSYSGVRRDAKACSNSCGTEARLFYYSTSRGSIETMVDLSGRAYKDLSTAFLYRKQLVKGCACKPEPWSRSARLRHRA